MMAFKDALARINRRRDGAAGNWHQTAILCLAWTTTVSIACFICLAVSSARAGVAWKPDVELYKGQCSYAKNANRGLQAALAVIAITLSICFDFFLRVASSPTAADLRQAHLESRSLDIGILSLRNMRQISSWRRLFWVLLLCSSMPLQLFLHSIVYITFTQTSYSKFIVSQGFTTGDAFAYPGVVYADAREENPSTAADMRAKFNQLLPDFLSAPRHWDKLEASECIYTYRDDPTGLQRHRDVLTVVKTKLGTNTPQGWTTASFSDASQAYNSSALNSLWRFVPSCFQERVDNGENGEGRVLNYCWYPQWEWHPERDSSVIVDNKFQRSAESPWETPTFLGIGLNSTVELDYCLSEPYFSQCKLAASVPILLVNFVSILIGCVSSFLIAYVCWSQESCQVLGDAIQMFMKNSSFATSAPPPPARRWAKERTRKRLAYVVGLEMWLGTYIPITISIVAGFVAFIFLGLGSLRYDHNFGENLNNRLTILRGDDKPRRGASGLLVYSFLANTTQLAISLYYFTFSSLYSMLFQGRSWANFSTGPQRLRVSFPQGEQQATHPFQYPFAWGLMFVTLKATLGWLLNQSFYVVSIASTSRWESDFNIARTDTYFGYSVRAMLAFIITSFGTALLPIILGFWSLPKGSAIIGTDSLAIAAFCPTQDAAAVHHNQSTAWHHAWTQRRHLQPLRWGVLRLGRTTDGSPNLLGLGTDDEMLGLPQDGHLYVPIAAKMANVTGGSRVNRAESG